MNADKRAAIDLAKVRLAQLADVCALCSLGIVEYPNKASTFASSAFDVAEREANRIVEQIELALRP